MAHLEKYKATSVGHMLAHYRRDPSSLGRENIDPARVGMDYTLALDPADGLVKPMKGVEPNWATVEGRIERVNERAKAEGKRAVRKDAKGAQTRFGGLGEGHESRDAGERSAGYCKGV